MGHSLAEVLNHHLTKRCWSFERLAEEAGLPRNTVYRWTHGEVKKVRYWQDLAKAARALDLTRVQASTLLQAAGHPSIEVLLERLTKHADRDCLTRWSRSTPHNLPAKLTSFVGRQHELDQIARLLSSARLVTLTGPGGSGKTRLALESARAVLDDFAEVCFVELAHVRDPELVALTISQALGLKELLDESPLQSLKTHLRERNVLLVLDNFEQIVAAAPYLSQLLWDAPGVRALVTSRTRLNLRGEREFAVPPLPLPDSCSDFEELARSPSVSLFADRALAANPSFTLSPRNAEPVAEVCARLDGLPLGIELAAARARQVKLASMLDRFPRRLALASAGPRDLPDRQRTLRAAIGWSYDLLEAAEKELFTCLGVFAGDFAMAAAESIADKAGLPAIEVAEGLESLVEQNLIRRTWDVEDEPRYEMLETIREYALEKLSDHGVLESVRRVVSEHYVSLAEQADLEGEGQACWLHRLAAEHDNFRAVLSWCREHEHRHMGLRLSLALMPMWELRDHHVEARTWLEAFMSDEAEVPPDLRARGMLWQGLLLMRQTGNHGAASRLFEEALALFRDGGDLNGASEALQAEGDMFRHQGNFHIACQRYHESLTLALQTGNAYLAAHGYFGMALCAQEEGQLEDAQQAWELMLEWAERSGNGATVALALNSLGEMARNRGAWPEAERYYEQTLRLGRELDNDSRTALALHNLGYVALRRTELEKAERLFADSLALYEARQYRKGVAEGLAGLGKVEAFRGRPERAARLCGASEAILAQMGARLDALDRADYEQTLELLRSRLGDRLEPLLDEGRAMLLETAVSYAIAAR